jgi:hypothetical protein
MLQARVVPNAHAPQSAGERNKNSKRVLTVVRARRIRTERRHACRNYRARPVSVTLCRKTSCLPSLTRLRSAAHSARRIIDPNLALTSLTSSRFLSGRGLTLSDGPDGF